MPRILAGLALVLSLSTAAAEPARFEVRGKDLLYDGKPIGLRGVSVGDPVRDRPGRPAADFKTIATDWKANVVRLGILPHTWKTVPHDRVLDRLGKDVEAALGEGLFVIINYAVIGWPDGFRVNCSTSPRNSAAVAIAANGRNQRKQKRPNLEIEAGPTLS